VRLFVLTNTPQEKQVITKSNRVKTDKKIEIIANRHDSEHGDECVSFTVNSHCTATSFYFSVSPEEAVELAKAILDVAGAK
jgi:hypothetical protein